jgi:CHAT domain-containing protein
VLTPPPETELGTGDYLSLSPANDGYLAASEVTSLRMDGVDWVVLSACNTATGDDDANLSALARAFLFAGASNLLASHWPVSDDVAPVLIADTIASDIPGLSRGGTLQRAMRNIRTNLDHPEWAHPFYWAPFVLIGDGATYGSAAR